jgi:N-acetylmuramoyl-L-alanine amidase
MSRVLVRLRLGGLGRPGRLGLGIAGCLLLAGCGAGTPAAAAHWAQPGTPSATGPGSASPSPSGSPSGATSSAPLPAGKLDLRAVSGKTIVIDAGHNGGNAAHPEIINKPVPMGTGTKACDTTGTETNSGYPEAAFTFDVAVRLQALLKAAGAHVVMTRTDNTGVGPCVDTRAAIGNGAHAAAAISIHADGAPASGHGFHVMEPKKVGAPSDAIIGPSHQLALKVRDSYRARTGIPTSTYIGTDGINPRTDMAGLNLSVVPKVLVECGNMRNADDAAFLTGTTGRQKIAEGLAAGLAGFLAAVA